MEISTQCPRKLWQQHKPVYWQTAHLHSPGSAGRALSDVEEASAAGLRLSTFAWRSSLVDDHGFALEQAHQVWRLLALSHSHLWMKSLNNNWVSVWTISFLGLPYCMSYCKSLHVKLTVILREDLQDHLKLLLVKVLVQLQMFYTSYFLLTCWMHWIHLRLFKDIFPSLFADIGFHKILYDLKII